jgi:transcriptional regulator with XRE-family HTH domain
MKHKTSDKGYFGRLVKEKRREKDMGLREFAKKIDISPTYLSRIENGLDIPPVDEVIAKMAEVLKVASDAFFNAANEVLEVHSKGIEQKKKQKSRRMPPEMYEAYMKSPIYSKRIPEFLRIAKKKKLSDAQWKKMIKALEEEKNGE